MTTLHDGYGLGLYDVADPYARAVGHTGEGIDGTYVSWARCLPEKHAVVVGLSNPGRFVDDIGAMAGPLVNAVPAR